jgi:hypothetical protein
MRCCQRPKQPSQTNHPRKHTLRHRRRPYYSMGIARAYSKCPLQRSLLHRLQSCPEHTPYMCWLTRTDLLSIPQHRNWYQSPPDPARHYDWFRPDNRYSNVTLHTDPLHTVALEDIQDTHSLDGCHSRTHFFGSSVPVDQLYYSYFA